QRLQWGGDCPPVGVGREYPRSPFPNPRRHGTADSALPDAYCVLTPQRERLMASGSPMGAGQPAVHPGARWETPEWFVVRTAGLPSQVLEELCCNRTYHLVAELALEAQWLATEGRRLADAVEHIIAGLEDGLKPRLVGLRRALFQSKPVGKC